VEPRPGLALHTDLYELRMAASYLKRDMRGPAVFSLFVRRLPRERGFLVASGLEDCLTYLESLRFEPEDLAYLGEHAGFDDGALEALRPLRFTGDVWAVPEGRVVFADEPLLEVTAPIAEAQLVETYLLNQVTFQTAVTSKAARCRLAARGADLVDFSFRRTPGVAAAMAVARSAAIAGFLATSNVEAARRLGWQAAGTMAHSYIEAFPNEEDAFRAFAEDFPASAVFLVDTYDTLEGVRRAAAVIGELGLGERAGVRLDSGDLATLAVEARRLLDEAGLPRVSIFVSGGVDEYVIDELVRAGAPIDAFGVGTKMGVSADAPYLDTVYKLVSYDDRPVMKLSAEKETAPGAKQVFRANFGQGDVIGLREEAPPTGAEALLEPAMVGGRRAAPKPAPGWRGARARLEEDLERLPEEARRIRDPVPPPVRFSDRAEQLRAVLRGRLGASDRRAQG
jgi:nicotinate phosphoribosyltransferase